MCDKHRAQTQDMNLLEVSLESLALTLHFAFELGIFSLRHNFRGFALIE